MQLLKQIKRLRYYILIGVLGILLTYLLALNTNKNLTHEDGIFEYVTSFFFLVTSLLFLIIFIRGRHIINLLFFVVFFFGFGEEISWGQRILRFNTPEALIEANDQNEFNIHNLEFFTSVDDEGNVKKGIRRYINVNSMYFIFCIGYGVLLPIFFIIFHKYKNILDVIGLKIPPVSLGFLFLINYAIFKKYFYDASILNIRIDETFELNSAYIFFIIALVFIKDEFIESKLSE